MSDQSEAGTLRRQSVKTMAGIAEFVGVSVSTVSRVINRPELVAASTRVAVEKAIAEFALYPNRSASGLRSGLYRSLSLLVGDISQPWYAKLTKSIEAVAEKHGFSVQLRSFEHDRSKMLSFLAKVPFEGVDGVILNTGDDLQAPEVRTSLANLVDAGMHVVLIGQTVKGLALPSVTYDDGFGSKQATEHLIDNWGLPLAFLGLIVGSASAEERLHGFNSTLSGRPGAEDCFHIVTDGYGYEAGYRAMRACLSEGRSPRAILAANDQIAVGAMRAIADVGLSVGEDIGVIGFGDLDLAPFTSPTLSSVAGAPNEIAHAALDRMMSLILGRGTAELPASIVIRRSLIVRESSIRRSLSHSRTTGIPHGGKSHD